MLNLRLTFADIDYEKTLRALFPRLLSALDRSESNHFAIRLLQKVGRKSEHAALDILSRLPDRQKNDIVISAFRMERERIIKGLRDVLHQNEYGRHIDFEDAFMVHTADGQVECWLQNVSINYHALSRLITPTKSAHESASLPAVSSGHSVRPSGLRAVGYAARTAGFLMNLGIGDAALSHFMKRDEFTLTVNKALEAMLTQNGIFAKVRGCEFLRGENVIPQEIITLNQNPSVPEELIESLLDVLASYIIELIDPDN